MGLKIRNGLIALVLGIGLGLNGCAKEPRTLDQLATDVAKVWELKEKTDNRNEGSNWGKVARKSKKTLELANELYENGGFDERRLVRSLVSLLYMDALLENLDQGDSLKVLDKTIVMKRIASNYSNDYRLEPSSYQVLYEVVEEGEKPYTRVIDLRYKDYFLKDLFKR